ncbi:MAG: hypothetical protein OHK005_05450 [Candidatus Methylacidiphilales bacterium]
MNQRESLRYERRAEIIKALAHPSRILMADALSERERCVCELAELVGADMSTVSKHLAVMKAVGLVSVEKRAQNVFYRLNCPCLGDFFRCVDAIQRQHAKQLRAACF